MSHVLDLSKDPVDLRREQEASLARPRLKYSPMARMLFAAMDLLYGKATTLPKVRLLETLARIPYQAWETRQYSLLSTRYHDPTLVTRATSIIDWGRAAQDNEFWHLVVIDERMRQLGMKEGLVYGLWLPRLATFKYAWFSRLLARINIRRAFYLNAEFEDHAEHTYMQFVKDHPELDQEKVNCEVAQMFGPVETWGDLFRRIGLDERDHMNNSFRFCGMPDRAIRYVSINR